jgi:energy-coupling factor transport system ATP-binding protein
MSIEIKNVSYTYTPKTPFAQQALNNVNLTVEKGEFVAVIGQTGSGKSTLAEHIAGLLKPSKGQVCIDGIDVNEKSPKAKSARQKVGMVFQYPEEQLFAETVYEDIAFGPRNQGKTPEEVDGAVRRAMEVVALDFDTFATRSPFQLSGGQMRRVAMAGIFAMETDYLILDEPSAGLDPQSRDTVFAQLMDIFHSRKIGMSSLLLIVWKKQLYMLNVFWSWLMGSYVWTVKPGIFS